MPRALPERSQRGVCRADRFGFLERHGFVNRHPEVVAVEEDSQLQQLASSWLLNFGNQRLMRTAGAF